MAKIPFNLRVHADDLKRWEAAANRAEQTRTEWIENALNQMAFIQAHHEAKYELLDGAINTYNLICSCGNELASVGLADAKAAHAKHLAFVGRE